LNSSTVSVVITSHNQKDLLLRSVDSALSQTFQTIEIIIADDASTDGSREYIKLLEKEHPSIIKSILHKNSVGVSANRNSGYRQCSGKYLTYLDGDDYYFPNKIEKELEKFRNYPELDVVYSNFIFTDFQGALEKQWGNNDSVMPEGDIFPDVITRNFPSFTMYRCELMKREVMEKINFLDEELFAFEDWDSRIRYSQFARIGYVNNIGSAYVANPKSISKSNSYIKVIKEMEKVFRKNQSALNLLTKKEKYEILKKMNNYFYNERMAMESLPGQLFLKSKYFINRLIG
jgi:glycosyltransferase involved in cell wall biosynthesis